MLLHWEDRGVGHWRPCFLWLLPAPYTMLQRETTQESCLPQVTGRRKQRRMGAGKCFLFSTDYESTETGWKTKYKHQLLNPLISHTFLFFQTAFLLPARISFGMLATGVEQHGPFWSGSSIGLRSRGMGGWGNAVTSSHHPQVSFLLREGRLSVFPSLLLTLLSSIAWCR